MSAPDPILQPTPPAVAGSQPGDTPSSAPLKLCLLIVFNHRFEANLPKLAWLYGKRFEHIRYLMPFYRGNRPDVIPVYNSSYYFQGFFMEAWKHLRSEGFTHFLVCADDMVLNPALNSGNFLESLRLGPDDAYIKHSTPLNDRAAEWTFFAPALLAFANKNGVNWQGELPSLEAAKENLRAKGYFFGRLGWHNLRAGIHAKGIGLLAFYFVLRFLQRRRDPKTDLLALPYPILSGNADLMLIPAAYMEKFSSYSSVLAAMGVFVEMAAPTALNLACPRVVGEAETGGWFARDSALGYRTQAEAEEFCRQHDYQLEKLLADFESRNLFLHPVKLSRWNYPGNT